MVKIFQKTLLKRASREYKKEYFKFFILQVFLLAFIANISGYLIGTRAVDDSYNNIKESMNLEDGMFSTFYKFDDNDMKNIEEQYDLKIKENSFYKTKFVNHNGVDNYVNVYSNREEINKIFVETGRMPESTNEILLEHTYANYNNYKINDNITICDQDFKIVGTGYFPDFSCIYKNDTDIAFKYKEFLVSYVNEDTFTEFPVHDVTYSYSYQFNKALSDEEREKTNEDIKHSINELAKQKVNLVVNFKSAEENHNITTPKNYASQYTPIILIFFYILIAIIAFVFSINTISRIIEEAKVIGTLRATGISRKQMVGFYLLLPEFVIFTSSVFGNLIGYYILAPYFANLFMDIFSFHLNPIIFYWDIFLLTTVAPSILLLLISLIIIAITIHNPIGKFLTGDIEHASQEGTHKLSSNRKFSARLKQRIFLRNSVNYIFLLIGVVGGSLAFTIGVVTRADTYTHVNTIVDEAFCDYLYMLNLPYEYADENIEKFGTYSYNYQQKGYRENKITMYGIVDNSKYIDINFNGYEENTVYISSAFEEKYKIHVNDEISLFDTNIRKNVKYKVAGIYQYNSTPCMFVPIKVTSDLLYNNFIKEVEEPVTKILKYYGITYDLHGIILNGYFSNHPLDGIPDEYIDNIITPKTLKEDGEMMVRILNNISTLMIILGSCVDVLMMFLLTKHLIDKNKKGISLFKILGLTNKEILVSYIVPSFIVVVISLILALPITRSFIHWYFTSFCYKTMLQFFMYSYPMWIYPICFAIGLISFSIVIMVALAQIKKVSLIEILKE